MGTLSMHTPQGEYLEGKLFKKDKLSGSTADGIPFFYRNPSEKEIDQIIENQPIKGLQMDKKSNIIYTSAPLTFAGSDEILLEDQGKRTRKVKRVIPDRTKSRRTDLRLRGVRNKDIHLGKFITLE